MSSQSASSNNRDQVARFHCTTADQTAEQAQLLADCCPAGLVITLDGTLGAGKTFFTRSFAQGLGVSGDDVTSPTYVLIQHYQGTERAIHHFDLYRLRDLDEWDELGADELLDSDGICLIEWANRFPEVLPDDRLAIQIESTGRNLSRIFAYSNRPTFAGDAELLGGKKQNNLSLSQNFDETAISDGILDAHSHRLTTINAHCAPLNVNSAW